MSILYEMKVLRNILMVLAICVAALLLAQNKEPEYILIPFSEVQYADTNTVLVTINEKDSNAILPTDYSVNLLDFRSDSCLLTDDIKQVCDSLAILNLPEMYLMSFPYYRGRYFMMVQDWSYDIDIEKQGVIGAIRKDKKFFFITCNKSINDYRKSKNLIDSLFFRRNDSLEVKFKPEVYPNGLHYANCNSTVVNCIITEDSLCPYFIMKEGRIIKRDTVFIEYGDSIYGIYQN